MEHFIRLTVTTFILIFSVATYSQPVVDSTDFILEYIDKTFPFLKISKEQVSQLSWVLNRQYKTNEYTVALSDEDISKIHIEVPRALTRLYCLQLLRGRTFSDYQKFVEVQPEIYKLSYSSFIEISRYITSLSDSDYDLLKSATILSSLAFSPDALNKYKEQIIKDNISEKTGDYKNIESELHDSLKFMSITIQNYPRIYPILEKHLNEDKRAQDKLTLMFLPQTNLRHMIYAEGGAGMFRNLNNYVIYKKLSKKDLDLWFSFWIINVSGFRGHISQKGSFYLNENFWNAASHLKLLLDKMIENRGFYIYTKYLEYRADKLHISFNMPKEVRLPLARLASMFRCYTPEDALKLRQAFLLLPENLRNQIITFFNEEEKNYRSTTPTHMPSLIGNTLYMTNMDYYKTLKTVMPIYINANVKFNAMKEEKLIPQNTILSFNDVCTRESIYSMINDPSAKFKIVKNGSIKLIF